MRTFKDFLNHRINEGRWGATHDETRWTLHMSGQNYDGIQIMLNGKQVLIPLNPLQVKQIQEMIQSFSQQ